jgi:two-component system sensor histidine kinase KdpD
MAVNLPADLPLVRADATLIEQALANVIGNATVHTPKNARIAIDARIDRTEIVLRVTDDGPGISANALPHIFDKFAVGREPGSTTADGSQSTGLGLAIAKGIMEAHGGAISVETPVASDRGARFLMSFPREPTPA